MLEGGGRYGAYALQLARIVVGVYGVCVDAGVLGGIVDRHC